MMLSDDQKDAIKQAILAWRDEPMLKPLPEPLRSQLMYGDYVPTTTSGSTDGYWVGLSGQWVDDDNTVITPEAWQKFRESVEKDMREKPISATYGVTQEDIDEVSEFSASDYRKIRDWLLGTPREGSALNMAVYGAPSQQRGEQGAFLVQRLNGGYKITYVNQANIEFDYKRRGDEFYDIRATITFNNGSWTAATDDTDDGAELALLDFLFYKNNGYERYGIPEPQPEEQPRNTGRTVVQDPLRNENGEIGLA